MGNIIDRHFNANWTPVFLSHRIYCTKILYYTIKNGVRDGLEIKIVVYYNFRVKWTLFVVDHMVC